MENTRECWQAKTEAAISAVPWERYETAYGSAAGVGELLRKLFFGEPAAAMEASHQLWCGLCHQHAYLSSAALPALDILLSGLEVLPVPLKVELLDILYGFAACTKRDQGEAWQRELREKLLAQRPRFRELADHPNEDISGFAENILEML